MAIVGGERLLELARCAVEREVRSGDGLATSLPDDRLAPGPGEGGVFVTLRTAGRLRGCIGTFKLEGSLEESIRDMAVSATHDARFLNVPLQPEDLANLSIEISLLTRPVPLDDPHSLTVGQHGILVRRGRHSGCFLPQVAVERHWDAEEFLSQCCEMKASLPRDAWADPGTQVCVFEAESVADEALGPQGRSDD